MQCAVDALTPTANADDQIDTTLDTTQRETPRATVERKKMASPIGTPNAQGCFLQCGG